MKRTITVIVAVAAAAIYGTSPAAAAGHCGVERWAVKTVTDGTRINLRAKRATIAQLGALPVPAGMSSHAARLPGESTVYQVTGVTLVKAKLEADSDYHLVLRSATGQTMIAEIPDPACARSSTVISQLTTDRANFDATFGAVGGSWRTINARVTVKGIAFFDVLHGQSGVAPNGIELHPVLSVVRA